MATYFEKHGSPRETWSEYGSKFTATMTLRCAWNDRFAVMAEWLAAPGKPYPYNPKARCKSASSLPADGVQKGAGSYAAYENAEITLNFSTSDWPVLPEQQISETIESTSEFLTLDPTYFRWGSSDGDALTINEAPGYLMRGHDYILTYYNVSQLKTAMIQMDGHVNAGVVNARLLGWSYPAETLLYNSPSFRRTTGVNGNENWEVTFRFSYRASGWNKFWRAKTGEYERIYLEDGGVYRPYPLGNFNLLF